MKIKLVRSGWKKFAGDFNVVSKPGKNLFDFMQNVQSAAYFSVNDMGLKLNHDQILPIKEFYGTSLIKFDRKRLRLK